MLSTLQYFSFNNIWFWVIFLLLWTLSAHRFLGVPFYYWILAIRGDHAMKNYLETVVPRTADVAIAHFSMRSPVVFFAILGFVFAFWAVAGFANDHEFLQASFLLFAPLALTLLLRLALARAIARGPYDFDTMYVRVRRYRRIHLFIAALVIFFVTMYGLIFNLTHRGLLS
jgi:hypothetical protein